MTKYFKAKIEGETKGKKIVATDVKEEYGNPLIYLGEKLVCEFPISKVEYWSFESGPECGLIAGP